MSQHSSLKAGGGHGGQKRNVLKRSERLKILKKKGKWREEDKKVYGLPKVKPEV